MKDVILAKISVIKNCLRRIKDVTNLDPEKLNNIDIQDIVILNLQRAIQASFDITNIIIKFNNLPLPVNYKNGFEILHQYGFIDNELKDNMIKMAGFRNIVVHDYQAINIEILKSILQT